MEFRKQSQAARVKSIPEMVQSSALSSALALTRLGRGRGRWGEQGGEAGEGLRGCGGRDSISVSMNGASLELIQAASLAEAGKQPGLN